MSASWPADKVERRNVADLVPYARNARTHSKTQIEQLVASIKEWGWTVPILLDEAGGIIAGHGRVMAAKKLGLETVPCMTARGWSDAQKRAYVIADNRLAESAGWDEALLAAEFADLKLAGFEMPLLGFSEHMLTNMGGAVDASAKLSMVTYQIVVDCSDERDQAEKLAKFEAEGLKCRPLML